MDPGSEVPTRFEPLTKSEMSKMTMSGGQIKQIVLNLMTQSAFQSSFTDIWEKNYIDCKQGECTSTQKLWAIKTRKLARLSTPNDTFYLDFTPLGEACKWLFIFILDTFYHVD